MRLPGWRGYAPDGLARDIETVLRLARRSGTHVIERTTASARPIAVALTLPAVTWTIMRTLSSGERVAWVVWLWPLAGVLLWVFVDLADQLTRGARWAGSVRLISDWLTIPLVRLRC